MSNYITIAAANKMTKAQLIEALMSAQSAFAAKEEVLAAADDLTEELELTQQKLKASQAIVEKLTAQPAAQPTKQMSPARAAYLASANARREASQAATEAYRAKCAAARAQAMATGKAVLV